MLTHSSVISNRAVYLPMFEQFKDGSTIREFIQHIEKMVGDIADTDAKNKFRGDTLEILAEIFFGAFSNDECVGVRSYNTISLDEDYGIDAVGINVNNHKVAIQVKYRGNPIDLITYSDLAKTFTSGIKKMVKINGEYTKLDLLEDRTLYLFTIGKGVTHSCAHVFGRSLVVIHRELIAYKIDNNKAFWEYAFNEVYDTIYPEES